MIIRKKGIVVSFSCVSCGCEFIIGIKSVNEIDGNYFCSCPMCGLDARANIQDVKGGEDPRR